MENLSLPNKELFHYELTGKCEAPSSEWRQEASELAEYELFVVTKGAFCVSFHQGAYTIRQGEYLLLPPSKAKKKDLRYTDSVCYRLRFSTNSVQDKEVFSIPQTGSIPKPEKVVVLMKQLQDAAKNKYPSLALDSMTTSVVAELYGQLQATEEESETELSMHKQIHTDILDYIERNIEKNIKISDIAAYFGYNEKYLSHLFSEITGTTLKQFILSRKVDAANLMLTDSHRSIADIAKALGFSDSHNFSRAYKNVTGLSPSEYRNAFVGRLNLHVV